MKKSFYGAKSFHPVNAIDPGLNKLRRCGKRRLSPREKDFTLRRNNRVALLEISPFYTISQYEQLFLIVIVHFNDQFFLTKQLLIN